MPDGRASAEAAYGSALSDDTPRAPPCVEMELAESSREYRIGYRIRIAGADGRDFSVSIEGTHQETPPEVIRHTSPSRAPCTNNRGTPSLPCYRLRSRHPG